MNPLAADTFDVELGRVVRALQTARPGAPIHAAVRGLMQDVATADGVARHDDTAPPEVDDSLLPSALRAVCADARDAGVDLELLRPRVVEVRRAAAS